MAMQPSAFIAAPARGPVAPARHELAAAKVATTLQISQLNWFGCTSPRRIARAISAKPSACKAAATGPAQLAIQVWSRNIAHPAPLA